MKSLFDVLVGIKAGLAHYLNQAHDIADAIVDRRQDGGHPRLAIHGYALSRIENTLHLGRNFLMQVPPSPELAHLVNIADQDLNAFCPLRAAG